MKAKTIKALDAIIAGLEELKEALESEASKSGSGADDAGAGKVSGPKKPAKPVGVPAKGKPARPAPDDDDDVDDGDDDDADADDDEDELPKAKAPVKGKQPAPAEKPKGKAKAKAAELTLEEVKEKLTEVMTEKSLGKAAVLKILKKHGATKSSELEEEDFAAVVKACEAALATVGDDEDEDEDSDD